MEPEVGATKLLQNSSHHKHYMKEFLTQNFNKNDHLVFSKFWVKWIVAKAEKLRGESFFLIIFLKLQL